MDESRTLENRNCDKYNDMEKRNQIAKVQIGPPKRRLNGKLVAKNSKIVRLYTFSKLKSVFFFENSIEQSEKKIEKYVISFPWRKFKTSERNSYSSV